MSCRVHILRSLVTLALVACSTKTLVKSQDGIPNPNSDGQLSIAASKTTLGVGESAQLTVKMRRPNLEIIDVTDAGTGTRYITTDESMVVPQPDGQITCIGTQGKEFEATNIAAIHGNVRSRIRVHLQANGPGPTLEIVTKKTTLHEGESVHFRVVDKNQADITRQSSGTRYLVFAGDGVPDHDVIQIDDENGVLSALRNLGKYQFLSPIIFVRNGNLVGWTELRIGRKRVRIGPLK
jgi:hypothetical protein